MTDEQQYDAPNQQVVRPDGSAPWDEGTGGGAAPKKAKPKADDKPEEKAKDKADDKPEEKAKAKGGVGGVRDR